MAVHYEATHYEGICSVFAVVLDNGARHGLTTDWTIRECCAHARRWGFTVETASHHDGVTVFTWHARHATLPDEPGDPPSVNSHAS